MVEEILYSESDAPIAELDGEDLNEVAGGVGGFIDPNGGR